MLSLIDIVIRSSMTSYTEYPLDWIPTASLWAVTSGNLYPINYSGVRIFVWEGWRDLGSQYLACSRSLLRYVDALLMVVYCYGYGLLPSEIMIKIFTRLSTLDTYFDSNFELVWIIW